MEQMQIVLTDIPDLYAVWYCDDYEFTGTYKECQDYINQYSSF